VVRLSAHAAANAAGGGRLPSSSASILPLTIVLVWVSNPLTMIPLIYMSPITSAAYLLDVPRCRMRHEKSVSWSNYLGEVGGGIVLGHTGLQGTDMLSPTYRALAIGDAGDRLSCLPAPAMW
jgi:hypothetical protein